MHVTGQAFTICEFGKHCISPTLLAHIERSKVFGVGDQRKNPSNTYYLGNLALKESFFCEFY